ncbi:MAG: DUF1217 domain-containing protein [Acetobacteraceae bacterium]|nr:DUF1217 domain-containing protein [Acetobacteraceae bacterium]
MSGSISYSYLPSLFSSSGSSESSSLLNILYGSAGQSGLTGQNPVTALQFAEMNETKEVAATAQEPQVARDVQAFRNAVANAKDPASLLANPAVLKVLLTANGLSDQIPYSALATKALLSNTNDSNSLVNQLTDTRWKTVAQTFDFANKGLSVIQSPTIINSLANGYAEVVWRQSLDQTTPGLSNALTFRSEASSITSVDQILGDPVMRTVVTTALGIPEQIAFQDLTAQEKAISNRVDITKFQDPKFVENFVQRYLLAASSSSTQTSTDLVSLAVQAQGLVV